MCKEAKPLDAFNANARAKDGKQSRCRDCNRVGNAKWRRENRPAATPGQLDRLRRERAAKRAWVKAMKTGRPCVDCGGIFHPDSMDYDHIDASDKVQCVSRSSEFDWMGLLEEIQKCDLVCSNCHRVRTAERRAAQEESPTLRP